MKILVIGATGSIGSALVSELKNRHEVFLAARKNADIHVDIEDLNSIVNMYNQLPLLDAVVVTAGHVPVAHLTSMSQELYQSGLSSKLLGQVNVVLKGMERLNTGGSFTLTSGSANRDPYKHSSGRAMVNGAIDGFVKAAAIELPNALRINTVSLTILSETLKEYPDYFRGFKGVSAAEIALAYCKSIEGHQTGQIYKVGDTFS